MEEKKVPWWRRALSFALDGIRSGFGLFSKSAKEDPQDEPETVSVQQDSPEETELIEHSPTIEPIAETASTDESVSVAEPVDDGLLAGETELQQIEPQASAPEADGGSNPRIERSESEGALEAEGVGPDLGEKPEEHTSGAKELAEKIEISSEINEERPSGAEAPTDSVDVMRGLKPPPPSVLSFSVASEVPDDLAASAAGGPEGAPPCPDTEPSGFVRGSSSSVASEVPEAHLPPISSAVPSFSEALVAALVTHPRGETRIEEPLAPEPVSATPLPQLEPEIESAVETATLDELVSETPPEDAKEETAEEGPAPPETPAEPEPEEELEPETEISTEPEVLPAPLEQPVIAAAAPADIEVVEPAQETEAPTEDFAERETPVELADDGETTPEPVADPIKQAAEKVLNLREEPEKHTSGAEALVDFAGFIPGLKSQPTARMSFSATSEPMEQITEPEAAAEMESEPAPVIIEEPAPAVDSVPEAAVSSVELSEPVSEEVTQEAIGQTGAVEEESDEEATPDPEAASQTEHVAGSVTGSVTEKAAEEVAEEAPEPVIEPMDLKEPIPEQAAEPTEANEAVPVAEEVAGEAVPDEEAPETAVEGAVPAEEAASEQPEVDQPEVGQPEVEQSESEQPEAEPVTAVAEPAEEPEAEIAPALAIEAASEPAAEAAAAPAPAATAPPQKPFIKLESRDNEADLSPFSVIVSQVYDGPLDLLLDLIRKQDIDVYDIPIARITAQFLAYVNQLKATDVDVAGEFIYTASLLIHIKSKMLLPRAPSGQDDAAEDPRRELVERLLEHERFKNAAQMLQQKQMLEAATWTNPGLREFQDDTSAEPEIAADTVDLVRIFRDILERARNRPVIDVEEDSVTVGQMIQFLSRRLTMEDKPVALRRLLSHTRSERALIAMFLALLELVRLQAILLRQDLAFSEIFIKKHTGFEAVMNEGAAGARDDWR